ncbi:MAG: murein biosynthesis integral membrane protein MurJ [Treponema sp.]|nr:MAG: murein biosynthesis integral membrane protein MurJ [Treponema sp.]
MSTETKKKSLLKSGANLSILTLVSRILGLLREMTKSAFMGTGPMADAFAVAFLIPNLLRRLFAENSITVAFIPTLKSYLDVENPDSQENKKTTKEFLSAVFTVVCFLTSIITALGILFAPQIIRLFFKNVADFELTVLLTRIMFIYLVLISVAAFFQGMLNSVKIFTPAGFTPILFNIIIIGFTYFLSKPLQNPAIAMSVGVTVGGLVQAFFQLPFVLKSKFKFSFLNLKKAFSNKGMKKVMALILPTIVGMAAYQLNELVSSSLASNVGVGVLSSLQYSLRLQELVLGVFAVSVGTVILPDLSGYAVKKQWTDFQDVLLKAIKVIALITIPATLFLYISGEHIITLVYKARSFDDESVRLTLTAFNRHVLGLFFIASNRIIAPAFYAQGNTKLPTLAGIISFAINITLATILCRPMKGGGIALALSLASFVNTALLFFFLRSNENLNIKTLIGRTIFFTIKILAFSIIAVAPLYFFGEKIFASFTGNGRLISEGVPIFINFLIFAAIGTSLLIVTGDKLTKNIIAAVKSKF